MRIHSSVTALSWIPLEAVEMMTAGLPFKAGVMHYDADYDILAERSGLRFHSEWLAPRGSLA